MKIALTVLAAAAGLEQPQAQFSPHHSASTPLTPAGVATGTIVLDVSGMQFNDSAGSALNEILSVFIGVGGEVTGIGWDVNLTSIGASWASEAVMGFEGQVNLTVSGDANPVTNTNYASGIIDLGDDAGLPNITVGADGILDIEFSESFVDNAGTGDNFFEAAQL